MSKIKYIYNKICQYYLVFVGVTSYLYNPNDNTFQQTLLTRFIAGLSNIYCIIMLLYVFYMYTKIFEPSSHLHPLIKSTTYINLILRMLAIFYTVLHRKWRQIKELELNRKLYNIENKYFYKHSRNNEIEKHFKMLSTTKYIILCAIHITIFMISFKTSLNALNWYNWTYEIYNTALICTIQIVIFKFYELVLKICKLMYYLNDHLNDIEQSLNTSNRNLQLLSQEIQTISNLHGELSLLLDQLLNLYQFQLITNRIFSTTSNVISIYYGYVFIFYYHIDIKYVCFGAISYLIFTLNLYLNDFIYEMLGKSFKKLIFIIQKFNLKKEMYKEVSVLGIVYRQQFIDKSNVQSIK